MNGVLRYSKSLEICVLKYRDFCISVTFGDSVLYIYIYIYNEVKSINLNNISKVISECMAVSELCLALLGFTYTFQFLHHLHSMASTCLDSAMFCLFSRQVAGYYKPVT